MLVIITDDDDDCNDIHCVPKNVPPYCDGSFVKSYPIFKILSLLEILLNFQQNSM